MVGSIWGPNCLTAGLAGPHSGLALAFQSWGVLRSRVVHFIPQKVCSTLKRSYVERKPSTRSTNLNVAGKSTADRSCCGCGCEVGAAKVATCSRLPSANFQQGSLQSFLRRASRRDFAGFFEGILYGDLAELCADILCHLGVPLTE